MKKRYVVMLKNDLGDWRSLGQYTKQAKAENEMKQCIREDKKDIAQGYKDLHNEYRIDEITL